MKKKHLLEIQRINASIPKDLLDRLMVKKPMFEAMKEIATRAIDDPNVDEETKKKCRILLKTGFLDTHMEVADPLVEKEISEYLDGEFAKARTLGRLPPPQRWPILKKKSKTLYVQNTLSKIEGEENKGNN